MFSVTSFMSPNLNILRPDILDPYFILKLISYYLIFAVYYTKMYMGEVHSQIDSSIKMILSYTLLLIYRDQ